MATYDRVPRARLRCVGATACTLEMATSDKSERLTRRLDPAKPGEMSQVSGGEVELVDVGGDRLVESVEVVGVAGC